MSERPTPDREDIGGPGFTNEEVYNFNPEAKKEDVSLLEDIIVKTKNFYEQAHQNGSTYESLSGLAGEITLDMKKAKSLVSGGTMEWLSDNISNLTAPILLFSQMYLKKMIDRETFDKKCITPLEKLNLAEENTRQFLEHLENGESGLEKSGSTE